MWYLDLNQFLPEPSSWTQAYERAKEQSREVCGYLSELTHEAKQARVCLFSTKRQERKPLKANTYQLSSFGFVLSLYSNDKLLCEARTFKGHIHAVCFPTLGNNLPGYKVLYS